jgi:hypothetical protein
MSSHRDGRTCLDDLAEGYITFSDLCPLCMDDATTALELVAGRVLKWHPSLKARMPSQQKDE